MSERDTQHDNLLFNMLKECKTLPTFLDHIFGFLQRRTDFYYEATDINSPVGLPQGMAKNLVLSTFLNWIPKNKDEITILQEDEVPPALFEEEVAVSEEAVEVAASEEIMVEDTAENLEYLTLDTVEIADKTKNQKFSLTSAESYNGAIYESYCWSQTITDVDIVVIVPKDTPAKNLKVDIQSDKICVKIKDNITLLEGDFCQKCKHNEAIWSVDKQKLQIHLDKWREMWWNCLLTTEEKLDLSNIDCSRPFEELPEEDQAKIEELGWNQERKRLGLPTSDELAQHKLLEKAWNAPGSPFSGEFDPTKVQFK